MKDHLFVTDAAIESMLARRAGRGTPPGLAASIADALDTMPPERPAGWLRIRPSPDWSPAVHMAWTLSVIILVLAATASAIVVGSQLLDRTSQLGDLPPAMEPSAVAAGPTATPTPGPTPFHPLTGEFTTVSGTGDCHVSAMAGVDPETGGAGWRVTCQLHMTDPRVGGTEIADRIRVVQRGGTGYVWIAEDVRITNDLGAWQGVLQTADDGTQRNGEGHFVGEGGYQGLEYHYFFGVTASGLHTRTGWIYAGDE